MLTLSRIGHHLIFRPDVMSTDSAEGFDRNNYGDFADQLSKCEKQSGQDNSFNPCSDDRKTLGTGKHGRFCMACIASGDGIVGY